MARPQKRTVDYFPHDCTHKRTMFIIEQQFGNDGYSFWFKLLELLGRTEEHFYNYDEPSAREYLLAYTHLEEDTANNILSLLAQLKAIDRELWDNHIIWSENFAKGVADVYARRKEKPPQRPSVDGVNVSSNPPEVAGKEVNASNNLPEASKVLAGIQKPKDTADIKRQSKVKESKGKEKVTNNNDDVLANLVKIYEDNIGLLTPMIREELLIIADEYPVLWFAEAIKIACNNNARRLNYVKTILDNWQKDGFKAERGKDKSGQQGPRIVKYKTGN